MLLDQFNTKLHYFFLNETSTKLKFINDTLTDINDFLLISISSAQTIILIHDRTNFRMLHQNENRLKHVGLS